MHQKAVADTNAKYSEAVTDDNTCQMQWWVVLVERAHSISSGINLCQTASLLAKIVGPSGWKLGKFIYDTLSDLTLHFQNSKIEDGLNLWIKRIYVYYKNNNNKHTLSLHS